MSFDDVNVAKITASNGCRIVKVANRRSALSVFILKVGITPRVPFSDGKKTPRPRTPFRYRKTIRFNGILTYLLFYFVFSHSVRPMPNFFPLSLKAGLAY